MYSIFSKLMENAGETPYQVAKATGVSQSTLSDWKTGKSVPRNPTMKKLADHYNVSVSYLKGESTEREEKPADDIGALSKEELDYIRWYREEATEKEKALVRMIVEGDAKK
ncbi:helix-turn-helix domain-containing protein [Pseudoflavonifractor phocaeensis]|uniref:helix-turn-helix domain-containing protein n=1 Tax=Pseudoflavonifractor phocaeensis TaxID=1870988 RepID=UPI00195B2DBA|nr:helix-turn-helix transcriptional regulator [Pseudoflavonifractor phocaeensis]MBM6871179.1 helix-turn-helix transcriptional regulator [Pseudoflavonifractor phocaeensis]